MTGCTQLHSNRTFRVDRIETTNVTKDIWSGTERIQIEHSE